MTIIFNRQNIGYVTLTRVKNSFLIPPCCSQLDLFLNTVSPYIIILEKLYSGTTKSSTMCKVLCLQEKPSCF